MPIKCIVPVCVFLVLIIGSCGDDPTAPSGPPPTSSVLSVTFTGDSSKVLSSGSSGMNDSIALTETESGTGAKGSCRITATWSICPDTTLKDYTLYRSLQPDISADISSATILCTIETDDDTSFTDDEADWATTYYYALKTTNTYDLIAWSNEISFLTPGSVPTPSILSNSNVWMNHVELYWSKCVDMDFQYYKLFCSTSPNIAEDTTFAERICHYSLSGVTSYTHTEADASTTYYYALITSNTKSMVSWSNELIVIIPEGIPDSVIATVGVENNPCDICALSSGNFVYVANNSDHTVSVIRTSDNSVIATVDVGENPMGVCSLPSGEYVYVANNGDQNVSVIRTSDNTVADTVDVGYQPKAICTLPSGEYVYVTNAGFFDDDVSVIRTSDNSVVATVSVGNLPDAICSLPSGEYVYVVNSIDDNVSVIRTSDNTVVATVNVGDSPGGICSIPSGEYVYVTNTSDDNVSVIRTSDNTIETTIITNSSPLGICSVPSGEYVYVTNSTEKSIMVIRTSDNRIVAVMDMEYEPFRICVLPSGEYAYVTNPLDNSVSVILR
ncbi:MAG: YncE family protein [Candidatus Aegiribacteria sp.]|nr:YncE family protein [Candidatus Aegiribacteria sp.]